METGPRNRVRSGLWPGSAATAVSSHWLPRPAPLAEPGAAACSWERLEMGCLGTLWRCYAGLFFQLPESLARCPCFTGRMCAPSPSTLALARGPLRDSFSEETDPRPSKFLQPPGPISSCPGRHSHSLARMEGNYSLSGWNVTRLGSAVLGGGSLLQPSFSCGHIPGVSLGQPRSFFHTLVPAPAGSGEGERAVSMATSFFVISYFLFYGFSNFEALQTVCRLWKGKVLSLPRPPAVPSPSPQVFPSPSPPGFPPLVPPSLYLPQPPHPGPQDPTRHLKPLEAQLFLKHLEKINVFSPKTK